jgi:hypothetical protein
VTLELPSPAKISVAAPVGAIKAITKDGTIICSNPVECNALRDTNGVIVFDPTVVEILLRIPAARPGGLGGVAKPIWINTPVSSTALATISLVHIGIDAFLLKPSKQAG